VSSLFNFRPGTSPLIVSMPHCGIVIPPDIAKGMTKAATGVPDTDWHLERLYDFAADMNASMLSAVLSRYVIDLNRDPEGKPLYPGADNTELCPTSTFDREPLYVQDVSLNEVEIARRRETYWRPYHTKLQETIAATKARHGFAVLFDAHSIRSRVPRFFEGRLPDFNLGTGGGLTADAALAESLRGVCEATQGHTTALNGRFKGGYITRRYGAPKDRVHAIQLELAQVTYMDERPPWSYQPKLAERIRPTLRRLLEILAAYRPA